MCFSLETSIVTFLTATITGIVAIYLKQYVLGILILCYSQMQLSEVLIWYGINNKNDNYNLVGTNYGKFLLPTHNIAIGLGIYLETGYILPLIIGLIFYIGVLIYYNLYSESNVITKDPNCDSDNKCNSLSAKLQWPFPHGWYILSFIISIILSLLYVKPFISGLVIMLFYLIFFIDFNNAFGSYWCWGMALLSPIIVALNSYLIKK